MELGHSQVKTVKSGFGRRSIPSFECRCTLRSPRLPSRPRVIEDSPTRPALSAEVRAVGSGADHDRQAAPVTNTLPKMVGAVG